MVLYWGEELSMKFSSFSQHKELCQGKSVNKVLSAGAEQSSGAPGPWGFYLHPRQEAPQAGHVLLLGEGTAWLPRRPQPVSSLLTCLEVVTSMITKGTREGDWGELSGDRTTISNFIT